MEFASFSHAEELHPWCCQKAQSGIDCYSSLSEHSRIDCFFEKFFKGLLTMCLLGCLCPWQEQNVRQKDPGVHHMEGSLGKRSILRNAVPRAEIGS